jgi:predicted glycosyltransferase involved in capsule biosynthesis
MVTFIIPYREKDEFRRTNIDFLISQLRNLKILDYEIIVVEHDYSEKYINPAVKKVFIKSDSIFNKSVCCNAGAREARNLFLFFNDCDIIMPSNNYLEALNEMRDFDIVNPYGSIKYYDQENTTQLIKYSLGIEERIIIPSIITGGSFLISKSIFMDIGGFDEECIGFGYEDTIFDMKIERLGYRIKTLKNNYCVHLYHPAPQTPTSHESLIEFIDRLSFEDEYYHNFKKNKALYESYMDMSIEELKNKINEKHT